MPRLQQNYEKDLHEDLAKRPENAYSFCDERISKFFLMLRKGAYPYECKDSRQRYNKLSLPDKKEFYSNLTMEDIIDADCVHAKRVCKFRRLS